VKVWAAACQCYFKGLRAGEALALKGGQFDSWAYSTLQDVVADSLEKPCEIRVRIKEFKTDQKRHGATVKMS